MQIETNTCGPHDNKLSLKLAALLPKKRTTNQAKIAEHFKAIIAAIDRGVAMQDIRAALAEEGVKVSSSTFKKLLESERKRRDESSATASEDKGGKA